MLRQFLHQNLAWLSVVPRLFDTRRNTIIKRVEDHLIEPSSCVKYLGVHLDQSLTFEEEIKNILKKMACGIKTLYTVKSFLHEEFCLKLLNALVLSQIQHPAILLNGISQNLITSLEKQLSWAVKACFNRNKYDSSSDIKIKHSIFPIKLMLANRSVTYFWKYQNSLIPAFKSSLKLPNANFKYLPRSETLMNKTKTNSDYLRNSFFNQVIPLWNKIPKKLLNPNISYISMKMNLRHHYRRRIAFELENPEHRKKCWSDYRFN